MKKLTFITTISLFILWGCESDFSKTATENENFADQNIRYDSYESDFSANVAFQDGIAQDNGANTAVSKNGSTNHPSIEPKYLIKNAALEIIVTGIDSVYDEVEEIIENYGGYISQLNLTKNEYRLSNVMEIRIPSRYLELTLHDIELLALEVSNKKIKTRDVGEEYIDVASRLKTKEEVRDRYVDVLRNKAKTVEDILKTEDKLGSIQSDIEAFKGRLKYLDDRIQFSTIDLVIQQKIKEEKDKRTATTLFFQRAGDGFNHGWSAILEFVLLLITIWPFALIITLVVLGRNRIKHVLKLKKAHG